MMAEFGLRRIHCLSQLTAWLFSHAKLSPRLNIYIHILQRPAVSLPLYFLLTSLFSFQDTVLGGNPLRQLCAFFAESLHTRHFALRITATS